MILRLLASVMVLVVTVVLTACANSVFTRSQNVPPVVVKSGYYVDRQPLPVAKKRSSWLRQPISLAAHEIPLSILMSRLLRDTHVNVTYSSAARPNRLVTLNYTGTLQGALKSISEQTNYHYRLSKNHLVWSYEKNS